MEHESDGDTNRSWSTWNGPKGIGKLKKNQDHADHIFVMIGLNTKKNSGDLKRPVVSLAPVKNYEQELTQKKLVNNNNNNNIPKPESDQENVAYRNLLEFEIQTDLQIPARRPNLVLINKKKRTCHFVGFTVSADHRLKIMIK